MAGFSVNKDYLERMMEQMTKKIQRDKAITQEIADKSYENWKQTSEYKRRQKSAKMLLKEINQLQSGYRKYSEKALGVWLVFHGERSLGSGGFGDFRRTIFSLESILGRLTFPRALDGTEVSFYRGFPGQKQGAPVASRSGAGGDIYANVSGGQQFFVGSSFRFDSAANDIPTISMKQMMNSLEEMFGSKDVVLRYHGAYRNGTINTRLNSKTIRDNMMGSLTPMTTSLGSKNAKSLFQQKGGIVPSKSTVDRVKEQDFLRLVKELGGDKSRSAKKGEILIPMKLDLLKDFEIYSDPLSDFMYSFEAKLDTMRWETYAESIVRANLRSANVPRMADFPTYRDFNRYLMTEYGRGALQGGVSSYVANMSGSTDSDAFYATTYHDLSYYRLSEYYHSTKSLVGSVYSSLLYAKATY